MIRFPVKNKQKLSLFNAVKRISDLEYRMLLVQMELHKLRTFEGLRTAGSILGFFAAIATAILLITT
jgi:hypothetical protein